MKASLCPVCGGLGEIKCGIDPPYQTCHGCAGKGWVEVQEDYSDRVVPPQTGCPTSSHYDYCRG